MTTNATPGALAPLSDEAIQAILDHATALATIVQHYGSSPIDVAKIVASGNLSTITVRVNAALAQRAQLVAARAAAARQAQRNHVQSALAAAAMPYYQSASDFWAVRDAQPNATIRGAITAGAPKFLNEGKGIPFAEIREHLPETVSFSDSELLSIIKDVTTAKVTAVDTKDPNGTETKVLYLLVPFLADPATTTAKPEPVNRVVAQAAALATLAAE